LVFFYQFFYHASLYFFACMFNKRDQLLTAAGLSGWVGDTNGFWIVIPLIGIYAPLKLIFENSLQYYRNFRPPSNSRLDRTLSLFIYLSMTSPPVSMQSANSDLSEISVHR